MCPVYPNFKEEEKIAHLGANVFWTGDLKSREIFLREIETRFEVISICCGKNDEMFYATT